MIDVVQDPPMTGLRIGRVADHPLRACYPYGIHDVLISLDGPLAAGALHSMVDRLFADDPLCRRIVAAPGDGHTAVHDSLEAAGFRRVAEIDLRRQTLVLFVAEPRQIAELRTALDDMPH